MSNKTATTKRVLTTVAMAALFLAAAGGGRAADAPAPTQTVGKLTLNGARYEGEIRDGKANGKGTLTYGDGRKYVGEFKDDRRQGQGIWTFGGGCTYEGGWLDDRYDGQGTETNSKRWTYVGEFRDSQRSGQGTMTFSDGRKYEGEWSRSLFHGRGTLTAPDGKQQSGGWEFGKYRGSNAVIPKVQPAKTTGNRTADTTSRSPAGGRDVGDAAVLIDENTVWRHLHLNGPFGLLLDDPSVNRSPENPITDLGPIAWVGSVAIFANGWENFSPELISLAPPSDWAGVTCDDSLWLRAYWPQPVAQSVARARERDAAQFIKKANPFDTVVVLARSRFEIKDPQRVKACRLSLEYWGGVAVYVNGKEVATGHLFGRETNILARVAEPYPESTYPSEGSEGELNGCLRQLREVEIPAAFLRPGMNVLAVEAHMATRLLSVNKLRSYMEWPPIAVNRARLTVAPADAAVTSGLRLQGIRVWNCAANDTLTAGDNLFDGIAPVEPVSVRAARNSVFSGRLMVGSDQPIKGLTVTVSDLVFVGPSLAEGRGQRPPTSGGPTGSATTIPSAAVRVRYAVPATRDKSWVPQGRFDGLLDRIPQEIPTAASASVRPGFWGLPAVVPKTATKALASLWFTVRVPANVAAGRYEGRITIASQGFPPQTVPLHVQVCDWVMPDVQDWRMQNFIYYAEETEAKHYAVTNYSARHLELVGKTLAVLAEVNSRQVMVNLVCDFFACGYGGSQSNPESLVRWIKQPDGTFKHDFTNFDRYLEMVAKSVGKPRTLRLNCWGEYNPKRTFTPWIAGDFDNSGARPVTVFDPATGQLSRMNQPPLGTEENYKFWKPVFDEILKKIKARGWLGETTLGYNAWFASSFPTLVDVANRLWPGGEWSFTGHNGSQDMLFLGSDTNTVMLVRHADTVYVRPRMGAPTQPQSQHIATKVGGDWGSLEIHLRAQDRHPLWLLDAPRRNTFSFGCRLFQFDSTPLNDLRLLAENYILCNGYDGMGDFGANLYPIRSPAGSYYCTGAGAGTGWAGDVRSTLSLLYPGPDGPVATERFEMLREGMELCEAVIFVKGALAKKRDLLSPDLQQRAARYLRERELAYSRVAIRVRDLSAMEDAKLLDFAGEVARELEGMAISQP
jgi:hypothetical protein